MVFHSEEEKSGESKNENDLNCSNKPKEGEEGGVKPKAKKGSEGNQGDTKTQDNQTPKEQVWEIVGKPSKNWSAFQKLLQSFRQAVRSLYGGWPL